jgi:hypothetical protein
MELARTNKEEVNEMTCTKRFVLIIVDEKYKKTITNNKGKVSRILTE